MVGAETLAHNLERVVLNLILPITNLCGNMSSQAGITLKIDAISMYGKLLQAFEDMMLPYSTGILDFIVAQLDQHATLFSGQSTLDPFEGMVIRELYSELISQSVDVCCSMVLIAPEKLSEKASSLFERSASAMKIVNDINCKYELVELIAQMCLLGLKSGEEQTPEEDFLDFEMRRIQTEDEEAQKIKKMKTDSSSNTSNKDSALNSQSKMTSPLWNVVGLSFELLSSTLSECTQLFEKEEYENDDEEDGEEEETEEDEESDEEFSKPSKSASSKTPTSTNGKAPSSSFAQSQSSAPSFEPVSAATASPSKRDAQESSNASNQDESVKRRQEESGTGTVIALLAGMSYKYFSESEHATCFNLVHTALLSKISSAFSSPDTYSKLPSMLDSLAQLISSSSPSLISTHYSALASLLENIMKTIRIWKSEDPSPSKRRIYGAIRAELLPAYSALLRQDPVSTYRQADHFMTAVTFLLADPMILADFAGAIMSINQTTSNQNSNNTSIGANSSSTTTASSSSSSIEIDVKLKKEAKEKLENVLLFQIVDSYLKELGNAESSVSMKKTVMQSIGKLALGVGSSFAKMMQITVPVLLFLGRQAPDLAPAAITSVAQILYAVRSSKDEVTVYLQQGLDQAIAMVLQDIIMSGFELSSELKRASGKAADITFLFSAKERMVNGDEEEDGEEDGEDEFMQDDNLADVVYKGECFIAYILHVPELVAILSSTNKGSAFEWIYLTLVELEQKPTLFEEDCMLKMTAVDIIVFLIETIPQTHSSSHRDKAIQAFRDAGIDQFEEELEECISRLEQIKF
jgi:hypothetical protein